MHQGAATAPGHPQLLKERVTEGLERVIMNLDDVIAFDASPKAHVRTLLDVFSNLRTHDLKLPPFKARLDPNTLDFLEYSISPAGPHSDTNKFRAVAGTPMATNIALLLSLTIGWTLILWDCFAECPNRFAPSQTYERKAPRSSSALIWKLS